MTIYKPCNFSWLNLVEFVKNVPKSGKLKKCTQKKQLPKTHLNPNLQPLFASQMSLSTLHTVAAVGPSQLSLSTHISKPEQTFIHSAEPQHHTKLLPTTYNLHTLYGRGPHAHATMQITPWDGQGSTPRRQRLGQLLQQ
jgi:hypothetical protein